MVDKQRNYIKFLETMEIHQVFGILPYHYQMMEHI